MAAEQKYTKTQLLSLVNDPEFQRRIDQDQELDRHWNAPKRTRDQRLTELALALGGSAEFNGVSVPAVTAGILMLLGTVDSPLLIGGESPRLLDADIALHLFLRGQEGLDGIATVDDLERTAAGLCDRLGLVRTDTWEMMREMVVESFSAMERIPNTQIDSNRCRFDLAWFARVTSQVVEMTGCDYRHAGWEMPMTKAAHYLVAYRAKHGGKTFDPADGSQIMRRVHELMDQRIAEMSYE